MTQALSSITRGPRQTNMELLRIVAMFMVLIVHADFFALGSPNGNDLSTAPLSSFTRIIIESLSIVCVNVFVLISGWFRIKPSKKGLLNFLFQCVFFYLGIYIVSICTHHAPLSLGLISQCFVLFPSWFIKSYLILYFLSPVLNAFCDKASDRQLGLMILAFYFFQTIYGCSGAVTYFERGYSPLSFVGLYLLAQFAKRCKLTQYSWGGGGYLSVWQYIDDSLVCVLTSSRN